MSLDQIGIMLTGVIAVWLTQSANEERRRYACLFGLVGQPFWFYAAFSAAQWGVFMVCFLYAIAWLRGFWSYWVVPRQLPAELLIEKPDTNFALDEFYSVNEDRSHG